MNKWVALILGALLGANANVQPTMGPENLLGAALDKVNFTVVDKGTYYSITRTVPVPEVVPSTGNGGNFH